MGNCTADSVLLGTALGVLSGIGFGYFFTKDVWESQTEGTSGMPDGPDTAPRQTITIPIEMGLESASAKCLEVLDNMENVALCKSLLPENFRARTTNTLKIGDEDININIIEIDEDKSLLHISSKPRMRTQVFDYGRGYDNVHCIAGMLSDENAEVMIDTRTKIGLAD